MGTKLGQLKAVIESIEDDATKFYQKGTAAAGVRIRKAMLQVKQLAKEVRAEVSEQKNKA